MPLHVKDPKASKSPNLLPLAEVAKHFSVTRQTVLNWEKAGLIPAAIRVGRIVRFQLADVRSALEAKTRKGSLDSDAASKLL